MALSPGTRIGSYQIVSLLGAGGMGEVYRATDSQLKRDVALKALPDAVAVDPDRLARFQREAEVLAALNHPNIAQIYGFAESGSQRALVMELVEGEDLASVIATRGPVPIGDAIAFAKQIAQALDYAHERGIVHRDLKPANVIVTPDGAVKVLDFGLAKAVMPEGSASSPELANSPTLTSPAMTQRGVILGTAAYMSPEQAKGRPVDKRSDIWAFGCVLYEMLTGTRAFDGEDVTDSIVAVMSREPNYDALPKTTPPALAKLIRRCLDKDRMRRLADIRDALYEIDEIAAGGSSSAPTMQFTPAPGGRIKWLLTGASLAAVAAIAIISLGFPRRSAPVERPLDVSVFPREGGDVSTPHLSRDGRFVAYRARSADGTPSIWVRDLQSGDAHALSGTEDGWRPFWSSDSRQIGFWVNSSLKRVPVAGGPVQVIAANAASGPTGADWMGDTVIFSQSDFQGLMTVPAGGGTPKELTKVPSPDWGHVSPSFLPDGHHFVFTAKLWTQSSEATQQGIYVGAIDDGTFHRILPDLSSAVYADPGYLLFVRDGRLTAATIDASGSRVGEPARVGDVPVTLESTSYTAAVSFAAGAIALRPPPADLLGYTSSPEELDFIDRSGNRTRIAEPRQVDGRPKINRDGTRAVVALTRSDHTTDLYLVDTKSGSFSPVTSSRAFAGSPVWSPDDTQLAYGFEPPGVLDDVYLKNFTTGQISPLIESRDKGEHPIAWSPDGRSLLVQVVQSTGQAWVLQLYSFQTKQLTPFLDDANGDAVFSPDGKYVAFNTSASGQWEALVTDFPNHRQRWPVTTASGQAISWSADGREILIATIKGEILACPVDTRSGSFVAGTPRVLARGLGVRAAYSDATRDHSRILIRKVPDDVVDRGEIRLLFGWTSRLGATR